MPKRGDGCERITVVLLTRHVASLDRLSIDIRLRHGRIIRRDALLRAIVEASIQRGLDLSEASSGEALVGLLRR